MARFIIVDSISLFNIVNGFVKYMTVRFTGGLLYHINRRDDYRSQVMISFVSAVTAIAITTK